MVDMGFDWQQAEREQKQRQVDNLSRLGPVHLGLGVLGLVVSFVWPRGPDGLFFSVLWIATGIGYMVVARRARRDRSTLDGGQLGAQRHVAQREHPLQPTDDPGSPDDVSPHG